MASILSRPQSVLREVAMVLDYADGNLTSIPFYVILDVYNTEVTAIHRKVKPETALLLTLIIYMVTNW